MIGFVAGRVGLRAALVIAVLLVLVIALVAGRLRSAAGGEE